MLFLALFGIRMLRVYKDIDGVEVTTYELIRPLFLILLHQFNIKRTINSSWALNMTILFNFYVSYFLIITSVIEKA